MTYGEKVNRMTAFLKTLDDKKLILLNNEYHGDSENPDHVFAMSELDGYLRGYCPSDIISMVRGTDFSFADEYFIIFEGQLYSESGESAVSDMDIEVFADEIVRDDCDYGFHEIREELNRMNSDNNVEAVNPEPDEDDDFDDGSEEERILDDIDEAIHHCYMEHSLPICDYERSEVYPVEWGSSERCMKLTKGNNTYILSVTKAARE